MVNKSSLKDKDQNPIEIPINYLLSSSSRQNTRCSNLITQSRKKEKKKLGANSAPLQE